MGRINNRNHHISGQQRPKPFPVVSARFRPFANEQAVVCGATTCQSLKLFSERQKALFMAQVCVDPCPLQGNVFSNQERGRLFWEKAYREQRAGKELDPTCYPQCAQCVARLITQFLGDDDEQRAVFTLTMAVTTGNDIILFDRNLSRDATHPSIATGPFSSLADFRKKYYASLEDEEITL